MRIAIVDPSNFTIPYDTALCLALVDLGLEPILCCRAERGVESRIAVPVRRVFYRWAEAASESRWIRATRLPLKAAEHVNDSVRLLRELSYTTDVLHYQWLPLPFVDWTLLQMFWRGQPLVVTVHDTQPLAGSMRSAFQSAGFIRAVGVADRIIVHTVESKRRLAEAGVTADRITIIPHPPLPLQVPDDSDLPERLKLWWKSEVRLLLFGHLKAYKGIEPLLDALATREVRRLPGVRLLLAGKSAYPGGALESMIKSRGLDDSVLLENRFVSDGELSALARRATALLFPYLQIDASGALLSVLGLGGPMVVSRLPTITEILPGNERIRFVTPGSVTELADALCWLHGQQRKLVTGDNLPHSHFGETWQHAAREHLRVYQEALCR